MESASPARRILAGRYELLAELGRGGMGVVYRALDRSLEETVALKVLRPELSADPDLVRRFRSEIKLARKVSHWNVCRIHDYGEDGGLLYISMEFVDGVDLKKTVQSRGGLPAGEAYDVALQVADGLEAIHRAGVIHRDLKTPNLMLDASGRVRVMDFGIAKNLGAGHGVTRTGLVVGTPDYMSPEQASGKPADARSDLYAFGVVIFELFSGELPFPSDTPLGAILKHLHEPPPLEGPKAAKLPPALIPVLRHALAKDPAGRYSSAADMAAALRLARAADGVSELITLAQTTPRPAATLPVAPRAAPSRFRQARSWAVIGTAAFTLAASLWALWTWRPRPGVPSDDSTQNPPSASVPADAVSRESSLAVTAAPGHHRMTPTPPRPSIRSERPSPQSAEVTERVTPPEDTGFSEDTGPSLPIGTRLLVRVHGELRSDRARPGDPFDASIAEPLLWNGRVVVPAGTPVRGRVAAVSSSGALPFLELGLTEIVLDGHPIPIRTGVFRAAAPPPSAGGTDVSAVVVGALVGGALGAVIGGKRGAAAGATAGAAVGAATVTGSPAGGSTFVFEARLPFKLAEPAPLPPGTTAGRSAS